MEAIGGQFKKKKSEFHARHSQPPSGDIQVAAQTDREEETRQNQRVHRPAEGFAARTSKADGKFLLNFLSSSTFSHLSSPGIQLATWRRPPLLLIQKKKKKKAGKKFHLKISDKKLLTGRGAVCDLMLQSNRNWLALPKFDWQLAALVLCAYVDRMPCARLVLCSGCRMCYIRKINMLIEGLPVLDTGSLRESRGPGAYPQACANPELPAGAAAAEDHGTAEGPAHR